MVTTAFEADAFFDTFSRFVDSSETGPWVKRLNARYLAAIHHNRHRLEGARVLDLASHDGRFSFAALANGAAHVVGIDHKAHLVDTASEHLRHYGCTDDQFTFVAGDMYDHIASHGPYDVILCFGIFYHINDHFRLLELLSEADPAVIIFDTKVSLLEGAVVELRSPLGDSPPPPTADVEGYPTRLALNSMCASFGWATEYFDWEASGLLEGTNVGDYGDGRRVTVAAVPDDHGVDPALRAEAVNSILEADAPFEEEMIAITMVANANGWNRRSLRGWVRRERYARQR